MRAGRAEEERKARLQNPEVELLPLLSCSVVSNPVRPHRRQPTRLPRPWDSPGKNTGVGCHVLLQCMKVKSESEVAQSSPTLRNPIECSPPGSSVHGIFQARGLEWGASAFSKHFFNTSPVSETFRFSFPRLHRPRCSPHNFCEAICVGLPVLCSFSSSFYWSAVALQCCVSFSVQQSESASHTPVPLLHWISFPFRSPQRLSGASCVEQ